MRNAETTSDTIDWFTRELRRNPERVDELTEALKRAMGATGTTLVREAPRGAETGEVEDLWDNVPV